MSYILDALRRLEQEKKAAKKISNPLEAVMDPEPAYVEPAGANRYVWLGAGLLLLVVAVTSTYWITLRLAPQSGGIRQETAAVDQALSRAKSELPRPAPSGSLSSLDSLPAPSDPTELPATESSSAFEETPPRIPEPLSRRNPGGVPGEVGERSYRPSEVTVQSSPEREVWPGEEEALPFGDDAQAAGSPGKEVDETVFGGKWGAIKINAIAWDPEEEGSFAVINLRTVHRGDLIDGLLVDEIQENGIIFKKDGLRTKVVLNRR